MGLLVARVYSFGMIRAHASPGHDATVTVPHGFVFVVKMFTVFASPDLGTTGVFFECFDDHVAFAHFQAGLTSEINEQVPCTITFNEAETFGFRVVSNAGEAADVSASGFALSLP